jgi:uncharacterized protein YjbI with pentapeptide repeats
MKITSILVGIVLATAAFVLAQAVSPNKGADLSGSRFQQVTLANARFEESDLTKASFTSVNLSGARITSANLSDVQISYAKLDGMKIDGVLVTDMLKAYEAVNGLTKR